MTDGCSHLFFMKTFGRLKYYLYIYNVKINQHPIMVNIEVIKVNYFESIPYGVGRSEYNGKALYRKYGKTYICHVYIDFFNKEIYIPTQQPKECKVLHGVGKAVNDFAIKNRWLF